MSKELQYSKRLRTQEHISRTVSFLVRRWQTELIRLISRYAEHWCGQYALQGSVNVNPETFDMAFESNIMTANSQVAVLWHTDPPMRSNHNSFSFIIVQLQSIALADRWLRSLCSTTFSRTSKRNDGFDTRLTYFAKRLFASRPSFFFFFWEEGSRLLPWTAKEQIQTAVSHSQFCKSRALSNLNTSSSKWSEWDQAHNFWRQNHRKFSNKQLQYWLKATKFKQTTAILAQSYKVRCQQKNVVWKHQQQVVSQVQCE